jgi:hypothetical protein
MFKNHYLYDLFFFVFFINCVFASSTNQDSKQHGFETSNDFEEDNQEYSKQIKDIKRFGSLCTFFKKIS